MAPKATHLRFLSLLALASTAAALTCPVTGGTADDSAAIVAALNQCNGGGTVLLDGTYTIGTVMQTNNLSNIAINLSGTLNLSTNLTYWENDSFQLVYQEAYTAWTIGGENIHIYGGGSFNGGGDAWYSAGKTGPVMWTIYYATNVLVEDISMNKSPFWHNFVDGCTNVTYRNVNFHSVQDDGSQAANTDGWDIYRSSYVTIENSNIVNGDDCVSFKPNSTYITVQNLYCNGSHGISVGSLGQYAGEVDIVENIYVNNVTMANAENGARIKAWGGSSSPTSTSGGGSGTVKNITFANMVMQSVALPIVIDQCYETAASTCVQYPSLVTINDVHYIDITGTGSKSEEVVTLVCSEICNDITAVGTNLVGTKGESEYICQNVSSTAELDFPCDASGVVVSGTVTKTSTTMTTSTKTSTSTASATTTTTTTTSATTTSTSTTKTTKSSTTKTTKTSTTKTTKTSTTKTTKSSTTKTSSTKKSSTATTTPSAKRCATAAA